VKLKLFSAVIGVLVLASCESWAPPVEEPIVVAEPVVISPSPPITTAPPPVPPAPVPAVNDEPVMVAPEPEPEALTVGRAEEVPDEVTSEELDFNTKFEDVATEKDTVVVYYGTNREVFVENTGEPIKTRFPEEIYGELPGPLNYGKALIVIPPRHKKGRLEGQIAGRSTNDKRYVVLKAMEHANYDLVMGEVQTELAKAKEGERTLVAYVHGFNTSFEKAARRAGQLKYDLDFAGPFFFFSWPSKASAFGYVHAANLAEISYTQMTEFLHDLTKQDADRIIIIAHSMGTRVLSHGLVDLAAQNEEAAKKITRVILAAPDIDARVFKERLLPKFDFLVNPITLYASDKDTALVASKKVNGLPRIGDVVRNGQGIQALENVVMIDASDVKSNLLNHTYFGDSVSIVDDFKSIVSGPLDAESRIKTLTRLSAAPIQRWKVLGE
jgi:esterase/lipase superfamily enzyme